MCWKATGPVQAKACSNEHPYWALEMLLVGPVPLPTDKQRWMPGVQHIAQPARLPKSVSHLGALQEHPQGHPGVEFPKHWGSKLKPRDLLQHMMTKLCTQGILACPSKSGTHCVLVPGGLIGQAIVAAAQEASCLPLPKHSRRTASQCLGILLQRPLGAT